MMRYARSLLALVFVFSFYPATIDSKTQVIFSMEAGKCPLTVEAEDEWRTLRLRVHHEYRDCHVGKDSMLSALRAALSRTGSSKPGESYSSLFIGRLIDYPWLSQYLAVSAYKDRAWNKKKGKPVALGINKYVANVLSAREITTQIDKALAESGYKVVYTTVEKVLVGGFKDVPLYDGKIMPGKIPFDAMVWFRLEKD